MKKCFIIVFAVLICCIQIGCTSMKYNYSPTISNLDFPTLNKETTVFLGEEMLIQGQQQELEVLEVKQLADSFCYDVPPSLYEKKGYDDNKEYFSYIGSDAEVSRNMLCDPIQGMYVDKKNNKLCIITTYGTTYCLDTEFVIKKVAIANANTLQKNLIYSGFDGKKVNFMYVERHGFQTGLSHNISYDLSKNKIIGYRGAKIKVINYTNESITYIVLQNFPER